MEPCPELRRNMRFHHEDTIMLENYTSGRYFVGKMLNYSRGGLYFESDFAPTIGTEIFIGIENSPFTSSHEVYRAKVVWIRELPDSNPFFFYGIGAKYC